MFSRDIVSRQNDFATLVMNVDDDLDERMSLALVDTVFTSNANTTDSHNGMCVFVLIII
jgi:hypothetical protein